MNQIHDIFDDQSQPTYCMDGLPDVSRATNTPTIIERIDVAATRATAFLRQMGMPLPDGNDVPTIDQTDYHLRELVNRAVATYYDLLDKSHVGGKVATSIEGVTSDDMFEVTVQPMPRGALHIHISLLLV